MQYRRNSNEDNKKNYLYLLIALGHGPMKAIGEYEDDMDNLVPKGSLTDNFSTASPDPDLQEPDLEHPFWLRVWGSSGAITENAGEAEYDGSGHCGYRIKDDIGLQDDNCEVETTFTGITGDGRIGIAINFDDDDNYCALYQLSVNQVRLIKRVAGVQTTLGTYSYTEGDSAKLSRYGDVLTVTLDDVVVATLDADTSLDKTRVGLIGNGTGTATIGSFHGRGVFNLPKGLTINKVEGNTFNEVLCHLRLGREGQSQLPSVFSRVIQGYSVGTLLTRRWTTYDFREQVKGFHINIDFPSGLVDASGASPADKTVDIDVEYRPDDDSAWSPISGSPFSITEKDLHSFTRTILHEPGSPLSGTAQQIRIRRKNTESEAQLEPDKCMLADVNEVVAETTQTYANITLCAVRIRATEQLSGPRPTITMPVKGVSVPTWDGTSGGVDTPEIIAQYSTNPVWIAADILLRKSRGLGNDTGIHNINWANFADVAAKCEEELTYQEPEPEPLFETNATESISTGDTIVVITDAGDAAEFAVSDFVRIEYDAVAGIAAKVDLGDGRTQLTLTDGALGNYAEGWTLFKVELSEEFTEKRHEFNGVFDFEGSALDALLQVGRVARFVPIKLGDEWNLRYEGPADPVALISEANMLADERGMSSLEIDFVSDSDRADIVEVQFLDAEADYEQRVEIAGGLPPASLGNVPIRKTIQLYGCTSATQARREAHYYRLLSRLIAEKIQFELPLHGLAHEPGDVIKVASVMPQWTSWTGLGSGSIDAMTLSQELVLETGVDYIALIRTDDNPAGEQVNITSPAGTYAAGDTIATDGAATAIAKAVVAIGTATSIVRLWRLIDWTLTEDKTVQIEAHQYDDAVYELQGWTDGPVAPPDDECLEAGSYFYAWGTDPGDPGDCPIECEFPNILGTEYSIEVSGDAASCVEVGRISEGGFFFEVSEGCSDEVCFHVTQTTGYLCCTGPDLSLCNGPHQCEQEFDICMDICS